MNLQTELKIHQLVDGDYVDFNVDLSEDVSIPITKSIVDIENVKDRKGDFTKTISLPGTANNNKIFSEIFNLARSVVNSSEQNFNPDFNPTLKAYATVYKNGIIQITGYLQLTNIIITDEQQIIYEVIILGRFVNLFQDIAELKLSALDLSEYLHTYTGASIQDSWTAPVGVGYVYGLIDYGFSSNEIDYFVDYFAPQIYYKTLIDKIFSQAGYRYSSAFFNSERFKRLVFPYCGGAFQYSGQEVTDRTFLANRLTDSGYISLTQTNPSIAASDELPFNNTAQQSNPAGYDDTLFRFTIPSGNGGQYAFKTSGTFNVRNTSGISQLFSLSMLVRKNSSVIGTQNFIDQVTSASLINIANGDDETFTFSIDCNSVTCGVGEVVSVLLVFSTVASGGAVPVTFEYELKSDSLFTVQPSARIAEGSAVDPSIVLPPDVNQTDLLASIIKLFNLYVVPDALDDKMLIIEPREDFYLNTLVDLTDYVDVQSGVKIMPMGALQYKSYNYTYQKDTDWTNKLHQDTFIDAYGIRKFKIINDFIKDEYQTEVIFAPTPLRDNPTVHDRVLSYIKFLDSPSTFKQSTSKPRILYYGGLIACDTWTLQERGGTVFTEHSYPYVGHLDSVSNPQFDLNWGVPTQVQYAASLYTTNNLFNLYHLKNILEITDPDSKVVEFKMHLNEVQQNQLSPRYTYLIDRQYYRLYIVDYDANSFDLTTIQFLKLKAAPLFVGGQTGINGGTGEMEEEGEAGKQMMPVYQPSNQRNNNSYPPGSDTISYGRENNISGDGVINNSNENFISGDNASVLGGSGNEVTHDEATLTGTNDFKTFEDGMSVINNVVQPTLLARTFTAYDVSGIDSSPIEVLPKYEGFITEIVDAYATIYFGGDSATPFTSAVLSLIYADSGDEIATFSTDISEATVAMRQRCLITPNVNQLQESVQLKSSAAMGDEGTGIILIEVHYRRHPLIY